MPDDGRSSTASSARLREPGAFARAAANPTLPALLFNEYGKIKMMTIAADHPARGAACYIRRTTTSPVAVDVAVSLLQGDHSLV